ncbi:MAG: hypothetical protein K8S15_04320 [Candidatus Aegiribacteria sp.]|nr:hypothetical protein [Candidatus Aegiribacteria sp.]
MKAIFVTILITSVAACEICSDLQAIGVPVHSAFLQDSMLVVSMSGSLAEGDSLLKHYGGVFFAAMDSIVAGWDIIGIAVELDEATLVFQKRHMTQMFLWITETTDDESIAEWVLNHTRVIRGPESD